MNTVAEIAIYLLEAIFVVGIAGSAIVVLLTFVEDLEVWFSHNPEETTVAEGSAGESDLPSTHLAY